MIAYSDTMKLSKRNDTGAYVVWIDGHRHSLKKFCGRTITDGKEAKRIFTALRKEWLAGKLAYLKGATSITLEEFKREFEEWAEQAQPRSTFRANRLALRKLVEFAGKSIRLDRIARKHLDDMVADHLKRGVSPHSINNYIRHAKAVLGKAVEWEHIQINPLAGFKQLRAERRPPAIIDTAEKCTAFLSRVADVDVRRYIVAYLYSGRRRAELWALEWRDVDWSGNRYLVRKSKAHLTRWYPMHSMLVACFKAIGPQDHGRVFTRFQHPDTITHEVKAALKAGGYGHMRLHDLRHTFASLSLMQGVSLETVQELLGQTDSRTTEIYKHLVDDHLQAAVMAVNGGVVDLFSSKNRPEGSGSK